MKYRIKLAYDGTDYFGWQTQVNHPTIQSILNSALQRLEGGPVTTHAAGRTDAGVHAEGQVVSFELSNKWRGRELRRAINGNLPSDVRVLDASLVHDDFHARFDAKSKIYRYRIYTDEVMDPFLRRYAWHYHHEFDLEKLQRDLDCLIGTHDFSAFTVTDDETKSRIRHLSEARFEFGDRILKIYFSAEGFLRYQVRTMIGALVESNAGRLKAGTIAGLISSGDRTKVGASAPAKGLTLIKVEY